MCLNVLKHNIWFTCLVWTYRRLSFLWPVHKGKSWTLHPHNFQMTSNIWDDLPAPTKAIPSRGSTARCHRPWPNFPDIEEFQNISANTCKHIIWAPTMNPKIWWIIISVCFNIAKFSQNIPRTSNRLQFQTEGKYQTEGHSGRKIDWGKSQAESSNSGWNCLFSGWFCLRCPVESKFRG